MSPHICSLIENYSNLILAIEDNNDSDPHWLCFYRIQMAYWIMSRMGRCSDLAMAHAAYSTIRLSWLEIRAYMNSGKFSICNADSFFKTIDLGFVGQNGPENPTDRAAVS